MRWVSISEGDTLALSIRKYTPPSPLLSQKEVVFIFLASLFSSNETNSLGC